MHSNLQFGALDLHIVDDRSIQSCSGPATYHRSLLTGIVYWLKHNFHYNFILLASYTRDSALYEPYVWTFLREKSNETAMYIALRVL
jgi:hypothetical protein